MNVDNLIPLANELPEGLSENALSLLEKMSTTIEGLGDNDIEWKPGLLKVVQATTDRSVLPKGASIGSMVLGDELMDNPLEIIPLRVWDSRQMWSPDKDDNRILCWSPDAKIGITGVECRKCPNQVFDTVNNTVACTKNKAVLSLTSDLKNLFITNFAKTNFSNGNDFQAIMKKAGVAPHKRKYTYHTEPSKKSKNVEALIATPASLPEGKVAEEVLPFLQELFNQISADRKAHLDDFTMMANQRKEQLALSAPEADPQGLIEGKVEEPTAEQAATATKYTL
jgi:hypothetical protein